MNKTLRVDGMEKEPTFEEAMLQLESIVKTMEEGKFSIEESIQAYEQGITLKNMCEKKLQDIKMRVEKITFSAGEKEDLSSFEINTLEK